MNQRWANGETGNTQEGDTKMTRFMQEITGKLGAYWQNEAEKEIVEIINDIVNGNITIDEQGIGRNRVGRVLMEDMAEKVEYAGADINREATRKAREAEVAEFKKNYKAPKLTAEMLGEMRNAFGEGAVVVDVITGRKIRL